MRAAVVIPNWNGEHLLREFLPSVFRQTAAPSRVVVVDNGSTDGSVAEAARQGAEVLRLERNAGFAAAVNRGLEQVAGEPLVGVVNNDVALAQDWLETLARACHQPGVWFAAGKVYRAGTKDLVDATFDAPCRGGCAWRCGSGRPDGALWSEPRPVAAVPLTAALFRRELFDRIGALDEQFESYLEDVELGLRAARAGYAGAYVPAALAWHRGSGTLGEWHPETVRRIARNQLLLVARHYPDGWFRRYGWPVIVAQGLWGLVALRRGRGRAFLRGKWEGVRRYREWRRNRRPGGQSQPAPNGGANPAAVAIESVLAAGESTILRLQRASGFETYWRIYFALAGGARR